MDSTISPKIVLEAMGGFAEHQFLSMFRALDVRALEKLMASVSEDWGRRGALTLRDFTKPIESLQFPRHGFGELCWSLEGAVNTKDGIADPLLLCYVSAMHIYVEAHQTSTGYDSIENSCCQLFLAVKSLGFYYSIPCAKFLLWMHDIACEPFNRDLDPRPCFLLHAFLILGSFLAEFGDACVAALDNELSWRDESFLQRSGGEEVQQTLGSQLDSVAGTGGQIARTLADLTDAVRTSQRRSRGGKDT